MEKDDLYETVLNITSLVCEKEKTFDLTLLFKTAMELVEKENISGSEKKQMVLYIVRRTLKTLNVQGIISENTYETLDNSVNTLGSNLIDLVILGTKKLLALNIPANCSKCFLL